MGDIVNLRRHRKAVARERSEAEAEANRVRFGRTKAERKLAEASERLEAQRLDGHRLERDGAGDQDEK